jgi:hypothetical protein
MNPGVSEDGMSEDQARSLLRATAANDGRPSDPVCPSPVATGLPTRLRPAGRLPPRSRPARRCLLLRLTPPG